MNARRAVPAWCVAAAGAVGVALGLACAGGLPPAADPPPGGEPGVVASVALIGPQGEMVVHRLGKPFRMTVDGEVIVTRPALDPADRWPVVRVELTLDDRQMTIFARPLPSPAAGP